MRALKIITTAALATVALTGCVFVPAVTATVVEDTPQPTTAATPLTAEDRYLEAVMAGITHESIPSNVEDMIVEMGHLTCDAWDDGATRQMLIAVVDSGIGDSSGFTPDAATIFVDAALTHLC